MARYRVTWTIDIEGDEHTSPELAAQAALRIQRNPDSIATVFTVTDDEGGDAVTVDVIN